MEFTHIRAARWAVFATFLISGLLIGLWAQQVPLAEARLGVSTFWFGIALLGIAIGAVISMPITAALINRFGSNRVVLGASLLFGIGVLAPIFASNYWTFLIGAIFMGLGIGSQDVSMNAHGLAVEKRYASPIMSGLHGAWSLGSAAGVIIAAWTATMLGNITVPLIFVAIYMALILYISTKFLPGTVDKGLSDSHFGLPTKATIGLGALCFLALTIEGSVLDWGAILSKQKFSDWLVYAGWAFGFYQGGMAVSRFLGDYLRKKYGAVNLVVVSAALAAVGMAAALFAPTFPLALVGYVIGGLGIGNLAPVLFAGGGRLEPDAPGRGIAAVVSMGYAGFLAGPPLIGLVAEYTGLQWSLSLTVVGAIIIAIFARTVAPSDRY